MTIQRFVNNIECVILNSVDSSASCKYINNRRASKDGVSPLFNTDGELLITEPENEKASTLNQQLGRHAVFAYTYIIYILYKTKMLTNRLTVV